MIFCLVYACLMSVIMRKCLNMTKSAIYPLGCLFSMVLFLCLDSCSSPYNPTAPISIDERIDKTIYDAKLKTLHGWYRDTMSIVGKNFGDYIPAVLVSLGDRYIKPCIVTDTVIKFIVPKEIEKKVYSLMLYIRDDTVSVDGTFQLKKLYWNNFIGAKVETELYCKVYIIENRKDTSFLNEETTKFTTSKGCCNGILLSNKLSSSGTTITDSCSSFYDQSWPQKKVTLAFSATIDTISKELLDVRARWWNEYSDGGQIVFYDHRYIEIRKVPYIETDTTIEGIVTGEKINEVLNKVIYSKYDPKKLPIVLYDFVPQRNLFKDTDYIKVTINKEQ